MYITVPVQLTISGSEFSANLAENTVTIAGVACVVTSSSAVQIICSPSQVPAGTHTIEVKVVGKGKAAMVSGVTCEFMSTMTFTSVNPASCSVGGENWDLLFIYDLHI